MNFEWEIEGKVLCFLSFLGDSPDSPAILVFLFLGWWNLLHSWTSTPLPFQSCYFQIFQESCHLPRKTPGRSWNDTTCTFYCRKLWTWNLSESLLYQLGVGDSVGRDRILEVAATSQQMPFLNIYIYIYNISLIPLNNHHGISINSYSYPSYCEELIVFSIFRKTNIML